MQKTVSNVMGNIKMKIRETSSTKEHTLGEKYGGEECGL